MNQRNDESVFKWQDYDEMVADANRLDLGLTASVWTNDSTPHCYFGTPFGGSKNSSIGREEPADELLTFLEQKVIHTRLGAPKAAALNRMLG